MKTDRSLNLTFTTDKKVKPAVVPVKCAVCSGFGTVNWGRASCHACKGKGFILVPAKEEEILNAKTKD